MLKWAASGRTRRSEQGDEADDALAQQLIASVVRTWEERGDGPLNQRTGRSVHQRLRRRIAVAAGLASLVGCVSCDRYRLSLPGDVRDTEGRPIAECKIQLLVQVPVSENWTGTISRESITDAQGRFSFSVLVGFKSRYRLRIEHPEYQAWQVEGSWPGVPNRFHITLRRGDERAERGRARIPPGS